MSGTADEASPRRPRLPGTVPGASRRNALVLVGYLFVLALVAALVYALI